MTIKKALHFCSDTLNSDFFSIQQTNLKSSKILSNYPKKWVSYYKENQLWNKDPALPSKQNNSTIFWGEENLNYNKESSYSEIILIARDFNINSGISIELSSPSGEKNIITIASKKELGSFKNDISGLELAQMARYSLIVEKLLKEDASSEDIEKTLSYLKYDAEIYKTLKKNQANTISTLETLKSQIAFTAPSPILDNLTFLVNYIHDSIRNFEES